MRKRKFVSKLLSSALAVSLAASLLPVSALAVTGSQVAADGTYSASISVAEAYAEAASWQSEDEDDWADYTVTVTLTVEDGVFSDITVTSDDMPDDSSSYFNKATTKSKGIETLLTGSAATADTINSWDAVSSATCTSEAVRAAALSALASASEAVEEVVTPVLSDGSSFPTDVVLTEATESASEVIAQLPASVTYYDEDGNAVTAAISWSCASFSTEAEAVNTFTWSADTSALADYDISGITTSGSISVTNPEAEEEPQEEEAAYVYVLMNLPFEAFYSVIGAENVDGVDAISAATSSKYNYYNLAGASYNNGDDDIDGVTYYVQLSAQDYAALTELGYTVVDETAEAIEVVSNREAYEISGIDTLFACGDYAYAVVEEQTNYLTAEIVDGAVVLTGLVGTVEEVEGMTYEFTTDTTYGDYQLNLDTDLLAEYGIESSENVVLVTLNTSDGCIYALLPVEEYWIGYELAWSTGHTTTVHNSVVNYALYEGMEGKTITSVTYYTYDGIYEFVLSESLLVTPYAEGVTAELAQDESAITISGIPEDAENVSVSLSYTEGSGRNSTTVAVEASYEDGVLTPAEALAAGTTYNITIAADNYAFETLTVTTTEEAYVYVLMNLPFEVFYSVIGAENVDGVDAISAATSSKYNYYNLAGASYNNGDDDIDGVTYYVQLSAQDYAALTELGYTVVDETAEAVEVVSNREAYEISGIDTLFACGDYAYAVVEEQANYLTAEIVDGAVVLTGLVGTVQTVEGMTYDFTTDTTYGDYQLNLDTDLLSEYGIDDSEEVVLVTLNTSDGCIYALLPVEGYWIGYELAWSTGHTTTVHNNVVNYALYEGMEGKTITSVTYYTYDGIYEFVLSESLLVTPYAEGVTAELAQDESAITISGIPEDAENVSVSLSYTEGSGRNSTTVAVEASYENGVLTPAEALAAGTTYNITIAADNYAFETLTVTTAEAAEEEPETEEPEETEPEEEEQEETEPETEEPEETEPEETEPEAEETVSVNGLADLGSGWKLYGDSEVVNFTGLYYYDGSNSGTAGWYYVVSGTVDFSYTGLVKNDKTYGGVTGWYYVKNGYVDFAYTGLVKYDGTTGGQEGWYYVQNAYVNFSYTGVASNSSGKWYVKNAYVQFSASGLIRINGYLYIVKGGKVLF